MHAALSLHRLYHDRDRITVNGVPHRLQVIVCSEDEAAHVRCESLAVLGGGSGSQGGQGASVETMAGADDFAARAVAAAPAPGELNHALVGLRAAVAEKHLAAKTETGDDCRQTGLQLVVIEIGTVHQAGGLLLYGSSHSRMTVPQVADTDTHAEI